MFLASVSGCDAGVGRGAGGCRNAGLFLGALCFLVTVWPSGGSLQMSADDGGGGGLWAPRRQERRLSNQATSRPTFWPCASSRIPRFGFPLSVSSVAFCLRHLRFVSFGLSAAVFHVKPRAARCSGVSRETSPVCRLRILTRLVPCLAIFCAFSVTVRPWRGETADYADYAEKDPPISQAGTDYEKTLKSQCSPSLLGALGVILAPLAT